MRTIETRVTVTPDGQLTVKVPAPADILPGEHRAVLVIDEQLIPPPVRAPKPPLQLKAWKWEAWPADAPPSGVRISMTMAGIERLFVDANVLIYATNGSSPWHGLANAALQEARQLGIELIISTQVWREYLATATRRDQRFDVRLVR